MPENPEALNGSSLAKRFAHGAFWNLAGTVGGRIFAFLGAVITARLLGQSGYGELAMIQSTLGLMGTFTGLGLGATAIKHVAELKGKDPERTGRIIALTYLISWIAGGLMVLCFILLVPWLATKTINAPHLIPELRLASISLLFSAIFGARWGILAGFQSFRSMAIISCVKSILSLPLIILLILLYGLRGAIIALVLGDIIGPILSTTFLVREYRNFGINLNFKKAWREKSILWQFSLPSYITSILFTPLIWATNAMLVNRPNGYAQLGLFNVCMQFQWLITAISTLLAPVSVSMLSELHGQEQQKKFAKLINLTLRFNWTLAIAGGFMALGLSSWLIMLFGHQFQASKFIFPVYICFTVISVAGNIYGQSFLSADRMWLSLGITIIWGAILLSSAKILVPFYGAMGLAYAFLLAYSLSFLIQVAIARRIFDKLASSNILVNFIYCILLISCGLLINNYINNYLFNFVLIGFSILIIFKIIINKEFLINKLFSEYYTSLNLKIRKIYAWK